MSHACHRFWNCYKTLTICSFLTRCTIPCACHAKWHLNVQKWSENVVFCTFWLRNVLRATTACTFSTFQLLKAEHVLYILTWKRASRHNGVQLFTSHLTTWLRTRPSGATNHWKNIVFRDFPTFSRTWIFFLLRLSLIWSSFFFSSPLFSSLLWLFPSLLFICLFSEIWLLSFLRLICILLYRYNVLNWAYTFEIFWHISSRECVDAFALSGWGVWWKWKGPKKRFSL